MDDNVSTSSSKTSPDRTPLEPEQSRAVIVAAVVLALGAVALGVTFLSGPAEVRTGDAEVETVTPVAPQSGPSQPEAAQVRPAPKTAPAGRAAPSPRETTRDAKRAAKPLIVQFDDGRMLEVSRVTRDDDVATLFLVEGGSLAVHAHRITNWKDLDARR